MLHAPQGPARHADKLQVREAVNWNIVPHDRHVVATLLRCGEASHHRNHAAVAAQKAPVKSTPHNSTSSMEEHRKMPLTCGLYVRAVRRRWRQDFLQCKSW